MICQVASLDSNSLKRSSNQLLWCNADIDWDIPQNIDEAYAYEEYAPAEAGIDKYETLLVDGLIRPSATAPANHFSTAVPTPYDTYHSVRDRRKEHHDDVDVCVGVDCDVLTCAPYSRAMKREEHVYNKWVQLEHTQHSRMRCRDNKDDLLMPAACRQNEVMSAESPCSKVPATTMMGPQKKRQENIRVLRCAGDLAAHAAHSEHVADCHHHGPMKDRKALWSIAHGGV